MQTWNKKFYRPVSSTAKHLMCQRASLHLWGMQAWNTKGVEGVHRFLARAYRLVTGELSQEAPSADQMRLLHSTIKRVRMLKSF